jgi:imidazolonepropionase-like amidohydrolase
VEQDRIVEIRPVGFPMAPIDEDARPQGATREIDVSGMYILPGFVDMHAHTGGPGKAPQAEYVHKLWLGNGITTSRGVPHGEMMWSLRQKALSERNEIEAPRMFTYVRPASGWDRGPVDTPEKAREWVRWAADVEVEGARIDGVKLTSYPPAIMEALIDEAHQHGLGTVAHLAQTGVARMNALDAAELGLDMMTHYYGLFEALFEDRTIQDFPADYNYQNEQHRFGQVGRLWSQSAEPGSEAWNALIDRFLELDYGIDPTMTIYEASRDVMRAREAEWHDEYTLPSLWEYYQPSRQAHGSYWFYWTTEDEYQWGRFYEQWMQFLEDYKNAGGIVTTGSDSGFIYKLYGFDYIRELELLREAGFNPLEVIRAATYHGALQLHKPKGMENDLQFGVLEPGTKADMVVVEENPLANLKVLYGTGTPRLNDETGENERVGGIKYTIKDGIVYDAQQLLADVREMVRQAKERAVMEEGSSN